MKTDEYSLILPFNSDDSIQFERTSFYCFSEFDGNERDKKESPSFFEINMKNQIDFPNDESPLYKGSSLTKRIAPTPIVSGLFHVLKERRDRRDYLLKKFKRGCIKNAVTSLNKMSDIHFYMPNSQQFTSNINYEENQRWFRLTLKEILLQFDDRKLKKRIKNNHQNYEHINNLSDKQRVKINYQLGKSFMVLISEYTKSEMFMKDLKTLNPKKQIEYQKLAFGNGSFMNTILYSKPNNRKRTRNILNLF